MSAAIDATRLRAALEQWEIGAVASIDPVPSSTGRVFRVRTASGGEFVLKSKPDLEPALREERLLRSLAARALPVAPFLATRTGSPFAEVGGSRFVLCARLPGEPLARADVKTACGLGFAIASVHAALAGCAADGFRVQKLAARVRGWAAPTIRRSADALSSDALSAIAEEAARELDRLEPKLPAQLIHRDTHAGNFLFEAGALSGVLDFDQALHGARIFDVCYCASSMLAGSFRERERRDAWPSLLRAVIDGYASGGSLAAAEREAVPAVLAAVELTFIAWGIESRLRDVVLLNQDVLLWLWSRRAEIEKVCHG